MSEVGKDLIQSANEVLNGEVRCIKLKRRGLVYCKDCKYWNKHHIIDVYVCSVHNKEGKYPYVLFETDADDFCSRGERINGTRKTD